MKITLNMCQFVLLNDIHVPSLAHKARCTHITILLPPQIVSWSMLRSAVQLSQAFTIAPNSAQMSTHAVLQSKYFTAV